MGVQEPEAPKQGRLVKHPHIISMWMVFKAKGGWNHPGMGYREMTEAQTLMVFHIERLSRGGPSSKHTAQPGRGSETETGPLPGKPAWLRQRVQGGCGKSWRSGEKAQDSNLGAWERSRYRNGARLWNACLRLMSMDL